MNEPAKPGGYSSPNRSMFPMSVSGLPLNANSQSSTAEIDHWPSRRTASRFLPL
jgi:hypothetical protein